MQLSKLCCPSGRSYRLVAAYKNAGQKVQVTRGSHISRGTALATRAIQEMQKDTKPQSRIQAVSGVTPKPKLP